MHFVTSIAMVDTCVFQLVQQLYHATFLSRKWTAGVVESETSHRTQADITQMPRSVGPRKSRVRQVWLQGHHTVSETLTISLSGN
jgi:hypothetical protein